MMKEFIVLGFVYIFSSFNTASAQKSCSSNYMNTSLICVPGHTSGEMVMLDFSPFETSGAPSCDCSVYVSAGNRLEFNYVFSPGYYGCGSVITITHRTMSTIRCLQGAESLTVTPGDSVTVQILRERETFDSKYCYLLRAYQISGLERIPGSIIVVCNHPSLPSTTLQTTTATERAIPVTTATSIITPQAEDDVSSTGVDGGFTISVSTNTINFTSTALVTKSVSEEVSTSYNHTDRTVTGETRHTENRQLAHFPWEIITPLSIIIFVLIVVAIIIFKVRRSRYIKSTYKPAESRATSWAFNQPSLNVSPPKKASSLKTNVEKTDSGVYSTLGENDKRSTESVHKAAEKNYREVSIDQAIVESEAKTQREQKKEGIDNVGFIEDEDFSVESSKDIPSRGSSESDITNFISKMYVTDTENQNYFLDYKDKTTCNSSKEENADILDSNANSVVSEQVPQTSEKPEVHPQLPIDTGYVIIDVLASI
ncbi:uncharacterized protein LOC134256290 [Saccostrea cucullata]|uniref:uncharacterized protein LOC134256290 n=1 Tax=Saccostrea cuccullata TaxID=36930 RepID=UPI002ED0101A